MILLLTPQQAAEACQVSRGKLDEWSHRTGFPVIREGGTVRIHAGLLDEWLKARALETNAPLAAEPLELLKPPSIPLVPPRRARS